MLTTKISAAGKWLEDGAAASYLRMTAAAGTVAGLVAAGRTRAQQEALYAAYKAGRGNLAAKPGTSLHESGLAIDVSRKSALQLWMVAGGDPLRVHSGEKLRAHEYGWYRTVPSEAWHFRYYPAKDKHKVTTSSTILPTLARVAELNCGGWGHTSATWPKASRLALLKTIVDLRASVYCLSECPEWMRDAIRDALPGGAARWRVRVRGSQAILRDTRKWASGPSGSMEFGPTAYHGGLWETLTQTTTKATLTVGSYHLPPNVVSSQGYQRTRLQSFLSKLTIGARLAAGDGADSSDWAGNWSDARMIAAASDKLAAPTYKGRSITDRIHVRGVSIRRYSVVPTAGSDHAAVLVQITIPANSTSTL